MESIGQNDHSTDNHDTAGQENMDITALETHQVRKTLFIAN